MLISLNMKMKPMLYHEGHTKVGHKVAVFIIVVTAITAAATELLNRFVLNYRQNSRVETLELVEIWRQ